MSSHVILASLRQRILEPEAFSKLNLTAAWTQELEFLYKNGVGIDEVLQYLYFEQPSLAEFELWIQQKNEKLQDIIAEEEEVLQPEDLVFFETNGYVVLKQALTHEACLKTQSVIWDFLGMNPDEPDTWYQTHPEQRGLMVNFFDHPVLEVNRASGRIRKAFAQLYRSEAIFKSIDKVSFNPPITSTYSFKGSALHWDVSLQLPIPFCLQGLIYLSDCGPKDGAFHCVPGFHKSIHSWMEQVPEGIDARSYALETLVPIPITGQAGDMVIWHQALPHCATANYGNSPRMVQYLTYFKDNFEEAKEWI